MRSQTGIDKESVDGTDQALEGADIIYEATNSRSPVFDGTQIPQGAHINTISDAVDEATIKRARVIAVRQTQAPLFFTMGDVAIPYETPELSHAYDDKVCRLGEIITGREPGRMSDAEVTYYGVSTEISESVLNLRRSARRSTNRPEQRDLAASSRTSGSYKRSNHSLFKSRRKSRPLRPGRRETYEISRLE